jgi:hypothetical protein
MKSSDDYLDWPNKPDLLVGQRISVEWKHGKLYSGKVIRYSPSSKIHTVLYDDGEEKYYDMFTKTFQIVIQFCFYISK